MPKGMKVRGVADYHEILAQVPKGRYALANPEEALRASKARTTAAIHGHVKTQPPGVLEPGAALKNGLLDFADDANMSGDIKRALEGMDRDKLEQLYRENRFVFEVGFNYDGVRKEADGTLSMSQEAHARKTREFQHVIDEYNRRFS